MSKNVKELIEQVFPEVHPPVIEDLCEASGDEAHEETEVFEGKHWSELSPEFLHIYRDAIFWLTPEAFYYYLPAFMRASVITEDINALFVHSILQLLEPSYSDTSAAFRKKRWMLLSDEQIVVLEDWLHWLLDRATPQGVFEDEVMRAIQVVQNRYWW